MARFTTIIIAAVASLTSLVSAGCSIDIINFNQVAVGHACIAENSDGVIHVASTNKNYFVQTSAQCGVGLTNQVLPADWSFQYKGKC